MISTEAFAALCDRQNVELNFDIVSTDEAYKSRVESYEPADLLGTIVLAGRFLRKNPGEPLANRPLHVTRETVDDVASETLITMVNDSINPHVDENIFSIACSGALDIDACAFSEISFAEVIPALRKPFKVPEFRGADIILDHAGCPLFLRKGFGESSSLALQPFIVNGVRYPEGSIARVEISKDARDDETGEVYPVTPYDSFEVIDAVDITRVAFKRLSAFAFQQGTRNAFKKPLEHLPARSRRIIKWLPLTTVYQTARAASEQTRALEAIVANMGLIEIDD